MPETVVHVAIIGIGSIANKCESHTNTLVRETSHSWCFADERRVHNWSACRLGQVAAASYWSRSSCSRQLTRTLSQMPRQSPSSRASGSSLAAAARTLRPRICMQQPPRIHNFTFAAQPADPCTRPTFPPRRAQEGERRRLRRTVRLPALRRLQRHAGCGAAAQLSPPPSRTPPDVSSRPPAHHACATCRPGAAGRRGRRSTALRDHRHAVWRTQPLPTLASAARRTHLHTPAHTHTHRDTLTHPHLPIHPPSLQCDQQKFGSHSSLTALGPRRLRR